MTHPARDIASAGGRLRPVRPSCCPTLTTLLPYRSAAGPVVIGGRSVGAAYQLSWARVGGTWRSLGELTPHVPGTTDAIVSFDPIRQHPPRLTHYPLFVRLRERSYATARAHRDHERQEL